MNLTSIEETALKRLSKRIRKLREEKGISQEKLAFKAKIHRNYLGSLERGEQNPSYLVLFKLSKALEIDLSDLLKWK